MKYFLARNQEVYGPVSPSQIQEMRLNEEILSFDWVCSDEDFEWRPTQRAPEPIDSSTVVKPLPKGKNSVARPSPTLVEPMPSKIVSIQEKRLKKLEGLPAIAFHPSDFFSGRLVLASEKGCEIELEQERLPQMGTSSSITLNVCNPKTGKSMNVRGQIAEIYRNAQGAFCYQVRWQEAPQV